jgi:hypothetical protein
MSVCVSGKLPGQTNVCVLVVARTGVTPQERWKEIQRSYNSLRKKMHNLIFDDLSTTKQSNTQDSIGFVDSLIMTDT